MHVYMYMYMKGATRLAPQVAPDFKNKDYNLTAYVYLNSSAENGVIASEGGRYGGWSFYLRAGKLVYHYNYFGKYSRDRWRWKGVCV